MKKLSGKVAIVTGSAAGIGKGIAKIFAKEGAKVVLADFDEKALNETVAEIMEMGFDAFGVVVDVSNQVDIKKMIDLTVEKYGHVDILVNNAGVGDNMQAAANVTDEIWNRVMNINVNSVMFGTREILPHFLKQGSGTIINMSSIAGISGGHGGFTYTTAKHAIIGMTKNVASHYGQRGITCNAIAPGHIETGFSAAMSGIDQEGMKLATRGINLMTRAGTVNDIAGIALFLASDDAAYVNGVTIAADGGWTTY